MDDASPAWMQDARVAQLSDWLINAGVTGMPRGQMLESYCHKLLDLGVPLLRVHVTQTAVHPIYGGIGFAWHREDGAEQLEYAHTSEEPDNWKHSPFFYMIDNKLGLYRETLWNANAPSRFPLLNEMKPQGATDYLAMAKLFDTEDEVLTLSHVDRIGEVDQLDGALLSWMSHAPEGFAEADIALIQNTFPALCLVLKSGANRKTAEDLLGIYLGRDAGRRVLSGEIQRGSTQWIDAVICYFDFEGFTAMSQRLEGEALIAMLNSYFAPVVAQIEAHGGQVLKFMGDGLLAIFDRAALSDAPDRALSAFRALGRDIDALSAARRAEGAPAFEYTAALHLGPVLYGNIGADERLDFTVIGPEVNLAARIGSMHKSLGQPVILSQQLAAEITIQDAEILSLGRYMLRGVAQPQELFTVYEGQ